jgi:hypothetical protein
MKDNEFLRGSRADFKAMLDAGAGNLPVPPEYREAVADALVGLKTHAFLVKDALETIATGDR